MSSDNKYEIALRVDVGGEDIIPHTFVILYKNGDGVGYGLGPEESGKLISYGKIYKDWDYKNSRSENMNIK